MTGGRVGGLTPTMRFLLHWVFQRCKSLWLIRLVYSNTDHQSGLTLSCLKVSIIIKIRKINIFKNTEFRASASILVQPPLQVFAITQSR